MHSSEKIKSLAIGLLLANFICSCGSVGSDGTDTIQPSIVSTTPANGANNIGVSNSITVTFSESMDSSTINTSTISMNKAGSNIAGTVTYAGNTATFTPSNPLTFNSAYAVTISGNVKDANGNNMPTNYTLSFTTASYPSNHPVVWESGQLNGADYTLEDIDSDGISDLSIRQSGTITYYSGKDFSQLWQFTSGDGHSISTILWKTAVGKLTPVDLDGDGQKEVLLLDSYVDAVSGNGSATLYMYDAITHALKWQTTYTYIPPAGSTGSGSYDAKIGDLDGDGVYEIIVTQHALYKPSGAEGYTADNWVKVMKGPNHFVVWDSGALAKSVVNAYPWYDINLDGINDLMISEFAPSSISIYNGSDFSQLWQFTSSTYHDLYIRTAETGIGKLTPVDMDGDGQKELLLTDHYFGNFGGPGITLNVYDALTHALKWQDTYTYTCPTGSTGVQANYGTVVRDIDGDGVYEIILTQYAYYKASGSTTSTYDHWVKVLKGPGHTVAWDSGPLTDDIDSFSRVVADINLDGIDDLIIRKKGTNPSITFYKGTDFSELWQLTSSSGHSITEILAETSVGKFTPVDLDGDGQEEVLILDTYNDTSNGNAGATLYIYDAATHVLKWQTTYTYTLPAGSSGYVSYRADVEDIDGDAVYEIILSQDVIYKPAGASTYTSDNWVKVLK